MLLLVQRLGFAESLMLESFQVCSCRALEGCPYALTFPDSATIYVSPAIFNLLESDDRDSVLSVLQVVCCPIGRKKFIGKTFLKNYQPQTEIVISPN